MNIQRFSKITAGIIFSMVAVSSAMANGNHAGGHDESNIGQAGVAAEVSRTIELDASDEMRFSKNNIKIRKGETIRFVVTNVGKVRHEFNLGTKQELIEHNELMKKFPDMVHEEANKVTIDPGQKGEVIWKFSKAGVVDFACLHPGHYEAGMKGQINVGKGS